MPTEDGGCQLVQGAFISLQIIKWVRQLAGGVEKKWGARIITVLIFQNSLSIC